VSSCSREEGASAGCGRVSGGCSLMMFSSCRRVSDCDEPESEELERVEEDDIVKIGIACSV
jgi:hypothetical protein